MPGNWPPKLIFNTDGHWIINYQDRWEPDDITKIMPDLVRGGVDALSVLIGIDDDVSWRGSPHAQLWGDNVTDWSPDPVATDIHGHAIHKGEPLRYHGRLVKEIDGRMPINAHECLHLLLAKIINDGRDLMQIYIDGARRHGMTAYASMRMNDGHTNLEDRGWFGRSQQKIDNPGWLIGWPARTLGKDFAFSWNWNYAEAEVRDRFLGLIDETLRRYDFDGIELDFCRGLPFFRPNEAVRNTPVMTQFVGDAHEIVRRRRAAIGRDLRFVIRVPVDLGANLEAGIDTETWISEGLADIFVLGSPSYCVDRIDIASAVAAAASSDALVFAGFDGATYLASPTEGYETSPSAVLCATALNGYREGAAGIHLFNYDYTGVHRAGPSNEDFNVFDAHHIQTMLDLCDPDRLERRSRCYYLPSPDWDPGPDHRLQVPRKIALIGRGAGAGHAMRITVHDDIESGKASGRIAKAELRLRTWDLDPVLDRVRFEINGESVLLDTAGRIENGHGNWWYVFDDPPLRQGVNTVLLLLEGGETPPEPWPTVQQCEIVLLAD
ncbi:MAG: hypothetical protein CMJ49_00510 [Planctomycetaceae bacterium]|nr:hypothetical protein [Planctomycetaceae bacterium]